MHTMYEIEVDQDVMDFLRRNAEPFSDTPNSVLRRLLLEPRQPPSGKINVAKPKTATVKPSAHDSRRTTTARAASGSLLPEEAYELPLVQAIAKLGNRAAYRDILEELEKSMGDQFTEMDRATLSSGGIRWHTRLQFVRLRLIERGLLRKNSPRGIWELSTQGQSAAKRGVTND